MSRAVSETVSEEILTDAKATGAPSANGELIFEEPWQGRVLSMAVHLSDCGEFAWDDFRARLIGEVSASPEDAYYVQFLRALEETLVQKGLLTAAEISAQELTLARAPHDHASN